MPNDVAPVADCAQRPSFADLWERRIDQQIARGVSIDDSPAEEDQTGTHGSEPARPIAHRPQRAANLTVRSSKRAGRTRRGYRGTFDLRHIHVRPQGFLVSINRRGCELRQWIAGLSQESFQAAMLCRDRLMQVYPAQTSHAVPQEVLDELGLEEAVPRIIHYPLKLGFAVRYRRNGMPRHRFFNYCKRRTAAAYSSAIAFRDELLAEEAAGGNVMLAKGDSTRQPRSAPSSACLAPPTDVTSSFWVSPVSGNERVWDLMYARLVDFHGCHGHTRVPQGFRDDPKLGHWVANQRQKASSGRMPAHRRERLEQLGFFDACAKRTWLSMFDVLSAFAREHGHTRVPYSCDQPPGFGRWVARQRTNMRCGKLSADAMEKLQAIGFDWATAQPTWNENYESLKAWRDEHGHCAIPATSVLGRWAWKQRLYRELGRLRPERITLLDSIGFSWERQRQEPQPRSSARALAWQARIAALTAYKEEHGHCNVSTALGACSLSSWVHNVRTSYRTGKLKPERIRQLEALGFRWRLHNERRHNG